MQDRVEEKVIIIRTSKLLGTGFGIAAFGLWHATKIHSVFRAIKLVRRGY